MAHFAKLDENNTVLEVLVMNNEDVQDSDGNEVEQLGIDFFSDATGHAEWKQTSYNGNQRKNYAGIGMIYDEALSCFRDTDCEFPSWSLNEDTCIFEAPKRNPNLDDGLRYAWSELTQEWVSLPEPTDDEE